jgi:glyoxylase-like metal-dependent hydrolase (beta-lactamase superfamily II)
MHVFVRDWLSANNVLLRSRDGNVLIDSGYGKHAALTLALLASEHGLRGQPLRRLVNTHCHSDHIGGNAAVQRAHRCSIELPEAEAPLVAAWDTKALLLDYADQVAEKFRVDGVLGTGSRHVWGDLEWQVLGAPGHDMRAVVFFNAEHGILISGDALWEHGYGFVMPMAMDADALPATRATLDVLSGLDIRVVIPGHGDVFTAVGPALERAYRRTEAFEADDTRVARHACKVILAFCLLDKQQIELSTLPAYLGRIGIYRDLNANCLHMPLEALAAMLVRELEKAGVAERVDGYLKPCG